MVIRTSTGRSAISGHIGRQEVLGRNLVLISAHSDSCPTCAPWQGQVYALKPQAGYQSLDDAIAGGLFHPNCVHSLSGYIEGTSLGPQFPYDDELNKARERQRAIERNIRRWKEREEVAVTPQAKEQSRAKISHWQAEQRSHVAEYNLRRKYNRENPKSVR